MIICIVTIYRNENPGSILQAYALKKVLIKEGHTVFHYKHISKSHTVYGLAKRIAASILKGKIRMVGLCVKQYKLCSKAHRVFEEISPRSLPKKRIDCYILGSDTIWDIEARKLKERCCFFGMLFKGSKIISYAASAANTSALQLSKNNITQGSLDHINAISVRDQHTKDLIQPIANGPVSLVCDPTLLLTADEYEDFRKPYTGAGKIVLTYLWGGFSNRAKDELLFFADKMGLKIVTLTPHSIVYADMVLTRDPWTFITYFENADYVITDTFHGCIFSIIFKKQFISIERGKSKVNDLLERLKLPERLIPDGAGLIANLEKPIDWQPSEEALAAYKAQSIEYLNSALGMFYGEKADGPYSCHVK